MITTKKLMAAAAAFALTASPVMAANAPQAAPARVGTPVGQSEQIFGEDGGGWLLFVVLGAAAVVGLILALKDPASP